jgi:predicted alpha/beta hydrolase
MLEVLLGVLVTLAVVLLAARLLSAWVLALPTPADEAAHVVTADGVRLGVWRYRPRGTARTPPVVLCHGLGATRYNLDLNAELSVARFLAGHGFDCFVLELRGCRGLFAADGRRVRGRRARAYDFDDHLNQDVPAVIEHVCRVTGSAQVLWLGHSMGGMLAYATLGGPRANRLAGLVAIGSPASFRPHRRRLRVVMRVALWLLRHGVAATLTRWTAWLTG